MNDVDILTPAQLFEKALRLKAPVFQRYYVWGEAQLEQMMDDIDAVEDPESDPKEFLGAIVIQSLGAAGGVMAERQALMIDGQQRLTTIYLLLSALCGIAKKCGEDGVASNIGETYLALSGAPIRRGRPKLVPTVQDRSGLWKALKAHVPSVKWNIDQDAGEPNPRKTKLDQQWELIWSKLNRLLVKSNGKLKMKEFSRLYSALLHGLQFVVINLDGGDDANLIFGKLNERGQKLELSDLVRNEVFLRFKQDKTKEAQAFHEKQWVPFEKSFGDPKNLDAFFPAFAIVKFKGKVTKNDAFPKLQKSWVTNGKARDARRILGDLQRLSPHFIAMYEPIVGQFKPKKLDEAVCRFARMPKTSVTWPFLIQVLEAKESGALSAGNAAKCFDIVESFLVRRAICGYEPTGLHAIFKVLWNRTKGDPRKVAKHITSQTVECPDDAEVGGTLLHQDSYTRKILPFILRERELALGKAGGFDLSDKKITVEHVMPQTLSAPWAKWFDKAEHGALLGTIGNLVPLTGKQNPAVGNQGWEQKRKRYEGSAFHFTKAAADVKKWDAKAIRKRSAAWTKWFTRRWPALADI